MKINADRYTSAMYIERVQGNNNKMNHKKQRALKWMVLHLDEEGVPQDRQDFATKAEAVKCARGFENYDHTPFRLGKAKFDGREIYQARRKRDLFLFTCEVMRIDAF